MSYTKHVSTSTEYQGESFTRSLNKKTGTIWEANETAEFEMYDEAGTLVSSGTMVKSTDNLSITVIVPSADTATLAGKNLLLLYLTDTVDVSIKDVIAEYKINYIERKGR